MSFTIILLASFFCLIVWLMSASSKRAKALRELADRRQRYVESISPNARIIVNNGIHLFFKDDVQQFFGFDESGNTYDFAGLFNISTYKYGIRFYHKDSMDILIGKDYGRPSITYPLPTSQIDAIAREMIPVLRNNLYAELEKEGVTPTHEYEHDGCIWGCDINNKKFFMTYGCIQIFNFSDLKRVTVEDLTKNSLCDDNYIIHVFARQDGDLDGFDYEISFYSKDEAFHKLLSMFKGIRNRQL